MTVAAAAEAHGDFARDRAHGSAWDAKQADLLDVSGVPEAVLLFGKLLRAAARAEDHADLALLVERHRVVVEAGVFQCFVGSGHGQRHYARYVLALARIDPGELVEFRNFSGNVHGQAAGIEARNAFDARSAFKHGARERILADAVRADHAHSGDDDASHGRTSSDGPSRPMRCNAKYMG